VSYAGAVDSALSPSWSSREVKYYLSNALREVREGNIPKKPITHARGCVIQYGQQS